MLPAIQQETLIKGVYEGVISVFNLPELLFDFTFDQLIFATDKGFKVAEMILNKQAIYDGFRKNINHFSGAKTVSETWQLEQAVFAKDGTKRPFKEFRALARDMDEQYNKNWLKTEQNAAFAQGQTADQWVRTEQMKDTFPLLQYQTVQDGRVRPEHRAWQGIIKPVDSSFWDTRIPPNDYGCRCRVIRLRRGAETDLNEHLKEVNTEFDRLGLPAQKNLVNDSKVFNTNPAKSKYVFKESTTEYFKDAKQAGVKKGKENYGLGYK